MPSEKSCGTVVFRSDAGTRLYLILHYEEGHWDFPKGHVEEGESETETALRELEEETGIKDAELVFGFHESLEYFYRREGITMHKEVVFFLAQAKGPEVRLSDEHVGFDWLTYEAAREKLTFKNAKDMLGKAERLLSAGN
jgi:bis(5'-nucleosidyl)-tetraphosphatase